MLKKLFLDWFLGSHAPPKASQNTQQLFLAFLLLPEKNISGTKYFGKYVNGTNSPKG